MKTRLGRYAAGVAKAITSDAEIRISRDIDGDPLVWCSTPGGDNPKITINVKRGEVLSVFAGDRRVE